MELQKQISCVSPADVLPTLEGTHVQASTTQRGVLQKRSADWPHEYNTQSTSVQKQLRSTSPTENTPAQRAAPTGRYFTSNVHAHHIELAGYGVERSEKQVECQLQRLYGMLQRSDKYQKYREKQPVLTVAEFLAREAAETRAREAREARGEKPEKNNKDKAVWPEFLEHAFWRALARWPPMGRKKYMLDGALRGRNELIQDSIYRDTGVERNRKQVSSHVQVLKKHLRDQPGVLYYMITLDNEKKRHRGRESSHACHKGSMRGRHHPHRAAFASNYDSNATSAQLWAAHGSLPSSFALGAGLIGDALTSPYAVKDFTMFVEDDNQPVHYFTQLSSSGKLGDLIVTDTMSWRRQFPEFDFLRSLMDDSVKQDRKVLVCDASIKIMTEPRPKANLSIALNLHTQYDLSVFESIECTTRFFDGGDIDPDPQFDGSNAHDLKEHRTHCDYMPDPHGPHGRLRIAFGSRFWVNRMLKYQSLRHKDDGCVSRSLLRLTATQDVYGIKPDTGEAICLLTILWRFTQTTRNPAEAGSMKWRAVTFSNTHASIAEQERVQEEDYVGAELEAMEDGHKEIMHCSTSGAQEALLYQQDSHLALDYHHPHPSHHDCAVQPIHTHNTSPLHLDVLASMQPDLEQPHASATPSASTDYSQQSLSNLLHIQDTVGTYAHDNNNFDFNGGHITITAPFEPEITLSAYDSFGNQSAGLEGLHALARLDQEGYSLGLACVDGNEFVDVDNDMQDAADMTCYSTKPNWHHANLISSLENAAEQYHTYLTHDHYQAAHGHGVLPSNHNYVSPRPALTQEEEFVAHGLHDAQVNVNAGLWNLKGLFQEDAGSELMVVK